MVDFLPVGETAFISRGSTVLEGTLELIPDAPLSGDGDAVTPRPILRRGGRIAERTGDTPAGGPTVSD